MKRKTHTPAPRPARRKSYFAFFLSLIAIALVAGLLGTAVKRTTRSHAPLSPAAAGLGGSLEPSASWVGPGAASPSPHTPEPQAAAKIAPSERREYWLAGFNFTEIVRLVYRVGNFLLTDPVGLAILGALFYEGGARGVPTRRPQNLPYHARNLFVLAARFSLAAAHVCHEFGKRTDESEAQNSTEKENPMPQIVVNPIFTERLPPKKDA